MRRIDLHHMVICMCICPRHYWKWYEYGYSYNNSYSIFLKYLPLKAWLYRDGFARFSNTRFSLSSIDDQCILCICTYSVLNLHISQIEFTDMKYINEPLLTLIYNQMSISLTWQYRKQPRTMILRRYALLQYY